MKNRILRNRYSLLLVTLTIYMAVMVVEGAATGRKAQVMDFENPFFDLNLNNIDGYIERNIEVEY